MTIRDTGRDDSFATVSIPKKAAAEPVKEEEPVKEAPPPTDAPAAAEPPTALDEREVALQALLEKLQEKTEKEIARVVKVCMPKLIIRLYGILTAGYCVGRQSSMTSACRRILLVLIWTRRCKMRSTCLQPVSSTVKVRKLLYEVVKQ